MPDNRDHRLYYGFRNSATHLTKRIAVSNFFILLGTFSLRPNAVQFIYDDFWNEVAFDEWAEAMGVFNKSYSKTGVDFDAFMAGETVVNEIVTLDHQSVFAAVIETARTLRGDVPANAEFLYLNVSPTRFAIECNFVLGDVEYPHRVSGVTYNSIIQNNLSLVENVIPIAHNLAFSTDPSFWATAEMILPE